MLEAADRVGKKIGKEIEKEMGALHSAENDTRTVYYI